MMDRFEIIGLALFCGIAFAAFLSPTVLLVWWLDRKSRTEKREEQ